MELNNFGVQLEQEMVDCLIEFEPSVPWYEAATLAMEFASPISLGLMGYDMRKVENKAAGKKPLTMYDFAVLNTNLERRTRIELGLTRNGYYNLMELTAKYAKIWNKKVKEIQEALAQKMILEKTGSIAPLAKA